MDNSGRSSGKLYADDLTWREQDILILLAERLTNQEIANRLHLAESTVKDYVGKILSKLYVKNRREAVKVGRALGLLDQDKLKAEQHAKPIINLPAESTTFVGRLDELGRIKCQIKGTRLLTLAGPGGIGKTRLALKAAETFRDDFKDGIFFVPLAPIRSAEDILQTIAESLKFPIATHENPRYQLLRYLERRQLLLLMDNYEHLLDGVGIISEIIQTAPEVKVLVTSRERLNLQSETVLYVGGMRFPDQAVASDFLTYDAINLFIQSASKVRPGYSPSEDDVSHIINICHFIGGAPLAIELAAAWLHILNVEDIFAELKKGLDILSSSGRDIPDRHSSIRTVFDHSWGLIEHNERETFTRLSVFRGGFTREAALQVAGATLLQLTGLVSKSFLSYDPESGRLSVHELLRQYAEEHLNANPEASLSSHDSHAVYYADFMQKHWEDLKCTRQMQALAEIEADIENIRAAWRHCLVQKDTAQIWKFIYGLWHFHWIRWWNHAGMELFAEAARVLEGVEGEEITALWALARALQSYFMAWLGLADQGYEIVGESVAILEQMDYPVALVFAYDTLGINAYFLFHYEDEIQTMEKMVEVARGMDDQWLLAMTLFGQGMAALIQEEDRKSVV